MCGKPATTREHIPPDGIFPDPKPPNLITVPSCKTCNEGSSTDDQYFIWFITTAGFENPLAEKVNQRVLKGFRQKPALLRAIMKKAKKVDVYSLGGIYLGRQPAFEYSRQRIQTVINKIVRGLFFKETKLLLGPNYIVEPFVFEPPFDEKVISGIRTLPLKSVGDGQIFSYRYLCDKIDRRISCWLLMFFSEKLIASFTKLT